MTQLDDAHEPLELPPPKVSRKQMWEMKATKEVFVSGDGTIVVRPRPARFKDGWLPMMIVGIVGGLVAASLVRWGGTQSWQHAAMVGAACFAWMSFVGWCIFQFQRWTAGRGPYAVFNTRKSSVDLPRSPGNARLKYACVRGFWLRLEQTSDGSITTYYQVCAVDDANRSQLICMTELQQEFDRILDDLQKQGIAMSDPRVVLQPRPLRSHELFLE